MTRRNSVMALVAILSITMLAGRSAQADRVVFRYVGGHWSHHSHAGWHRYWGGPSIGFYFAPAPVYIVSGYPQPSYYTGTSFWYSNPSFGLSINLGGGSGGSYRSGRTVYHQSYSHDGGHGRMQGRSSHGSFQRGGESSHGGGRQEGRR